MKEIDLPNLEEQDPLREVLYHLKELLRSQSNIADLLKRLDAVYGNDLEETALCLTDLEVEAIDHAGYHVKELRGPLRKLVTNTFNLLHEENEKT